MGIVTGKCVQHGIGDSEQLKRFLTYHKHRPFISSKNQPVYRNTIQKTNGV